MGLGKTVFKGLARFAATGEISSELEPSSEKNAGNGALMRLAPVALAFYPDRGRPFILGCSLLTLHFV